jgi:hypothetical protein
MVERKATAFADSFGCDIDIDIDMRMGVDEG